MPAEPGINSIALIGAGPIIIGQACEFDYSGTQACKALREEGYRVVLINSNPATIMTDPGTADATYVEPITPAVVARVLERERPDALLPTMGGQTALNAALALADDGTLARLGVRLIGANQEAIAKAEDRQRFHDAMDEIGLASPASRLVGSHGEAMAALEAVGLPAIIRPSYTLGGTGGGIVYNRRDYQRMVEQGLDASPVHQVLIEESVLGWKEFEMEVVRDRADNAIIVCAIENLDPMGVHTGDSVTVAPALTLTDKEYQVMRNAAIAVLREVGVDTGGSNVQFAVHPDTGRMVVIEMNPRVSRSSALASKATGFPIAKIAAKLAVGYTLDELSNDITGVTPASFEPTIDYVVTKAPRFAFEKFPGAEPYLTTAMKSVGEAMSIGRNFQESVQKALRSLEIGLSGFDPVRIEGVGPGPADREGMEVVRAALARPRPQRLLTIAQAFRHGLTVEQVQAACQYDPWFLRQIAELVDLEDKIGEAGLPTSTAGWAWLKGKGYSDVRLASLVGLDAEDVAARRRAVEALPVYKRVDTCAGEFPAQTSYMYSAYEALHDAGAEDEARPTAARKAIILGGGPNRIGQGIEFDYCCVHACFALQDAGFETIMVNCNPETVSTDYDTADRLYFEPLTDEDAVELIRREARSGDVAGAIVQYGGQTPLKLARTLEAQGVPILGTAPDAIDLAEDRWRFQELLHRLDLKQPANAVAYSRDQAIAEAQRIGYPLVLRPSYVLGGRAMEIVQDEAGLIGYIDSAVTVSGSNPVLLDSYLTGAVEVDVDAVADGDNVYVAGIMEHIEEAGIHSGDSACALPPQSLSVETLEALRDQTRQLALGLHVVGLMNVQFAVQQDRIFILEVNPRASRTVPFVAKATGVPIAKIAARVMAGEKLDAFGLSTAPLSHVAVKEAVFPFDRFPGVDTLLGPEMKSTGEVMGIDRDLHRAFGKAQLGAGVRLPQHGGTIFISVRDGDKPAMVPIARRLLASGYRLIATGGTYAYLRDAGFTDIQRVNKVLEGEPHVVDAMIDGRIQLVINTSEGKQAIKDSFSLRRTALEYHIPYYTTVAGARAVVDALAALGADGLDVAPLQHYAGESY